jgi:formate dehydrogenase (NADP+) beta subunit
MSRNYRRRLLPVLAARDQSISCQVACPVHTDARGLRAGDCRAGRFEEAYLIARGPNPFASICGRVCGAPCEVACRRGKVPRVDDDGRFVAKDRPIAIRALKRFVCELFGPEARPADAVLARSVAVTCPVAADAEEMAALLRPRSTAVCAGQTDKRLRLSGWSGGLSAAHDLALLGFRPWCSKPSRCPRACSPWGAGLPPPARGDRARGRRDPRARRGDPLRRHGGPRRLASPTCAATSPP